MLYSELPKRDHKIAWYVCRVQSTELEENCCETASPAGKWGNQQNDTPAAHKSTVHVDSFQQDLDIEKEPI